MSHGAIASGQIVDNPGFKALPRPIHYATPLAGTPANNSSEKMAGKDSVKAVIVYGKNAAWTQKAAEAVQKSIQDWSARSSSWPTTEPSPATKPGCSLTPVAKCR